MVEMTRVQEVVDFYATAFDKDGNPTKELLDDKGKTASQFLRPSLGGVPPESIIRQNYLLSSQEIAFAMADLAAATLMPPSEARAMKVGAAVQKLQNAEYRLRMVTRS
jgi:hypothetical protein